MKKSDENPLYYNKKFLQEFEEAFAHEKLASQITAAKVLCLIFSITGMAWLVAGLLFENFILTIIDFQFPATQLGIMLLLFAFFEGSFMLKMRSVARQKKKLPWFSKYVSSFIEVTLLTLLLWHIAVKLPATIMIFESPGIFLYFFLIILSILKLSPFLGLFTGAMCAIGYLSLYCYFINDIASVLKYVPLYSFTPNLIKAGFMIVSGGISGFVAGQLNQKIQTSIQNLSRRHYVTTLFGQYLSPVVAEKILSQKIGAPPELSNCCILFFDLRDFTSFSEGRSPKEVIDFLNIFFAPLIDIITKNHGVINKFLGDGFMAIFGVPITDEQDKAHAVKSAFQMIEKIRKMNNSKEMPFIHFGIGIHAGLAMTGSVGSAERKEYTVIGDTVNIASRVEQLNKEYHSTLIVTDVVYEAVRKDFTSLAKHTVQIRGKQESIEVYILDNSSYYSEHSNVSPK